MAKKNDPGRPGVRNDQGATTTRTRLVGGTMPHLPGSSNRRDMNGGENTRLDTTVPRLCRHDQRQQKHRTGGLKVRPSKIFRRKCLPSPCSSCWVLLILFMIGLVRQWPQPTLSPTIHTLLNSAAVMSASTKRNYITVGDGTGMMPLPLPSQQQQPSQHVVFIGDSILLYSYLEFADRVHYHRPNNESAPGQLIHVRRHASYDHFFQYTVDHFQGYMSCDCYHQDVKFNPGTAGLSSRYENRFYSNGSMTATYLRGYYHDDDYTGSRSRDPHSYNYVTRGRYRPHELPRAQILLNTNSTRRTNVAATAASANSDPAAIWQYQGLDWDQLIRNYVSQLLPKPTAIVFHVGIRPNDDIAINMSRILRAARLVVGEKGIVIWRQSSPRHNETNSQDAPSSPADEAARDWSYNIPGILYQPFPSSQTMPLSTTDYYDHYHFSQPSLYQLWNMDLNRALWNRPPVQRVAVIVAGAIRTLPQTHQTMMQNLVRQLCPPYSCISHLILHISGTDNRPDRTSVDPRGMIVASSDAGADRTYFQNPSDYNWPDEYLQFHWVDEPYHIGSPEEQAAMDQYEEEFREHLQPSPEDSPKLKTKAEDIVRRFSLIRYGDPRRYSMWFSRAWAWRYTKKLNISFDFHVFIRPDLLWLVPVPTMTFFREYARSDREVWVHDRYYADVPDTFAFLPTRTAAENYLSLRHLLHPRVSCLGGPDFKKALVRARLYSMNITIATRDWCRDVLQGYSEYILDRKLVQARLPCRYIPFGMTLWRPPAHVILGEPAAHGKLMCEALEKRYIIGFWKYPSLIPLWACVLAEYALKNNWTLSTVSSSSRLAPPATPDIIPLGLFRWRRLDYAEEKSCLTRMIVNDTITWVSAPCEDPIPGGQMYAEDPTRAHSWLGFDLERSENILNISIPDMDWTVWFREPVELYSSKTVIHL